MPTMVSNCEYTSLAKRLAGWRAFDTLERALIGTLTALAGAEPIVGAQHAEVQRPQFFLSESPRDAESVNARRLEVLLADPRLAPRPRLARLLDFPATPLAGVVRSAPAARSPRPWPGPAMGASSTTSSESRSRARPLRA